MVKKSKSAQFVQDVLDLAEKNGMILFTEYGHLCFKDKGTSSNYARIEDFVDLPDSDSDSEEIFGVDYSSMSLEELRARIESKH